MNVNSYHINETERPFGDRNGNGTVEFALAAAVLLIPLLLFMVDAHRMYSLHSSLSLAAREGAVQASRGSSPDQAVLDSLSAAGYDPAMLVITTQVASLGDYGEEVLVELNYDAQGQLILPLDNVLSPLASASASAKVE